MAKETLTLKPERKRRKIDEETAQKIITDNKNDCRKTIEEAFKKAGINEFEFHLLSVLHRIKEELSEIKKVVRQ